MKHVDYMKSSSLIKFWSTIGLLGVLAGGTLASAQVAADNKIATPTNAAMAKPVAPVASQAKAPVGGAVTPESTGKSPSPDYANGNSPVALGGQFGRGPVGGTLSVGGLGGAMTGQNPPGGQMNGIIIGGAITPGFPPGGVMRGPPAGGSFGSNMLGGLRAPSNSLGAGPKGVTIGGTPTPGVSPGGVIVAGPAPGGALVGSNSPGGIMVQGAPPNTNAPGGQLR